MNRLKNIASLDSNLFDVCIIGGGATGAGCALDAVQRGLKTILIEKDDFAAGTSSKSTKLFHGGVRYLEKAVMQLDAEQFRMVYKSLHERRTLISRRSPSTMPRCGVRRWRRPRPTRWKPSFSCLCHPQK